MSAAISRSNRGIIIQYDFCTGCHACEVACKKERGLGRWDYFFLPAPTDLCNLCEERVEAGKLPACVHNCQAKVMEYGDVEQLAKKMTYIKKCVLFAPGDKA